MSLPESEAPIVVPIECCPLCGSKEVVQGYGLAGGGIGTYWACDDCDWFAKQQDRENTPHP